MKTCFGYNGVVLFERKGLDSWCFSQISFSRSVAIVCEEGYRLAPPFLGCNSMQKSADQFELLAGNQIMQMDK